MFIVKLGIGVKLNNFKILKFCRGGEMIWGGKLVCFFRCKYYIRKIKNEIRFLEFFLVLRVFVYGILI